MFTLNLNGRLYSMDKPIVMGILNITNDSFYDGSRYNEESAVKKAMKMMNDGAAIIDIGGQSTRSGSSLLSTNEELKKILPVIERLVKENPEIIISVDTFYAKVAREAVQAGALMINDITAGAADENMLPAVAELHVPYIAMHMKGMPQNMQELANYNNVTVEVLDYFLAVIDKTKKAGIHDLIIDVGFGFAKNTAHNFELLRNLFEFKMLEKPLMVGLSRKSMVYKTLSVQAREALNGTTALHTIALLNGADILRVHDVKEAVECIKLISAYKN